MQCDKSRVSADKNEKVTVNTDASVSGQLRNNNVLIFPRSTHHAFVFVRVGSVPQLLAFRFINSSNIETDTQIFQMVSFPASLLNGKFICTF